MVVGAGGERSADPMAFERKLYVIRKLFEKAVAAIDLPERTFVYIPSLSSRTLIYKGMLSADQIEVMYPDLRDPAVESALALVHQRFSTNTFPSWPLAHPYRYIAHNGEINTLQGNINWMKAREALCRSAVLGDDLWKVLPVTREGLSDTATFDNVLEFLVMNGRSLPHAILMMIPEPWQNHESMSPERRAFYEYHSSLMEPWDGPASIAFTDGVLIGAVLDRNGLRPSRYYVTNDDVVIMASEVGVLDIPPENIRLKERLRPGRIFLVDTAEGRIVSDEEIKARLAAEHPYAEWLRAELVTLDELPPAPVGRAGPRDHAHPAARLRLHPRGPAPAAGPHGQAGRGAGRLDGHRHRAGGPLRPAAAALRLLQAALRPGHQPAAGRHPGGAGDLHGEHDRPGGEPPGADTSLVPPDRGAGPGALERGGGQARPRERPRLPRRPGSPCTTRWRRARPGSSGRSRTSGSAPARRSATATTS